jgi:hypothetical protein
MHINATHDKIRKNKCQECDFATEGKRSLAIQMKNIYGK